MSPHPGCRACRVVTEQRLTEQWDINLIHDLFAAGVQTPLLERVARLAKDAQRS